MAPTGLWSWAHSAPCLCHRAGMLSWVHPMSWATGNLWPEVSAGLPRTKLQRGAQSLTLQDIPRPSLSGATPRSSHDAALPAVCTPPSPLPQWPCGDGPVLEQGQVGSLSRAGQASVMHCGNIAWVPPEHAMQLQCTTAAREEDAAVLCASEGWGPTPTLACRDMGVVPAAWSKCRVLASRTWDSESLGKVQVEHACPQD